MVTTEISLVILDLPEAIQRSLGAKYLSTMYLTNLLASFMLLTRTVTVHNIMARLERYFPHMW